MNVCTIDIGKGGGLSWIDKDMFGSVISVEKMPQTTVGIFDLIKSIDKDIFVIEMVSIRPSDMEDGSIYRKIDVMIRNKHIVEGLLEVCGKKFIQISPRKWQSRYTKQMKGLEYTERKRYLKDRAVEIFKNTKVTLWNSDALLMLNFMNGEIQAQTEWLRDVEIKNGLKFKPL